MPKVLKILKLSYHNASSSLNCVKWKETASARKPFPRERLDYRLQSCVLVLSSNKWCRATLLCLLYIKWKLLSTGISPRIWQLRPTFFCIQHKYLYDTHENATPVTRQRFFHCVAGLSECKNISIHARQFEKCDIFTSCNTDDPFFAFGHGLPFGQMRDTDSSTPTAVAIEQ